MSEIVSRYYFEIADIPIQVESEFPIEENIFSKKLRAFSIDAPREFPLIIRHKYIPENLLNNENLRIIHDKPPWKIIRSDGRWIYFFVRPGKELIDSFCIAAFNDNHSIGEIYHRGKSELEGAAFDALTLLTTDQIMIAHAVADRRGCYLHAAGVKMSGTGLIFAGHSGAGKSTISAMLRQDATILCDDRIIVREVDGIFSMFGTWSSGVIEDVSNESATAKAIFFIEKSAKNKIERIEDKKIIIKKLLAYVIRPLETVVWWEKSLAVIESLAKEVPCYLLKFEKSNKIVELLKNFV